MERLKSLARSLNHGRDNSCGLQLKLVKLGSILGVATERTDGYFGAHLRLAHNPEDENRVTGGLVQVVSPVPTVLQVVQAYDDFRGGDRVDAVLVLEARLIP